MEGLARPILLARFCFVIHSIGANYDFWAFCSSVFFFLGEFALIEEVQPLGLYGEFDFVRCWLFVEDNLKFIAIVEFIELSADLTASPTDSPICFRNCRCFLFMF